MSHVRGQGDPYGANYGEDAADHDAPSVTPVHTDPRGRKAGDNAGEHDGGGDQTQ